MSYCDLLNKRYSIRHYKIILIIIFVILLMYLGNKSINDIYKTIGYVTNNKVIINIPLEYSDTLNKLVCLKIDNDNYYLDDLTIGEIQLDQNSLLNYQEVAITPKSTYKENMIVPITIYYQEEKVFKKFQKLLF